MSTTTEKPKLSQEIINALEAAYIQRLRHRGRCPNWSMESYEPCFECGFALTKFIEDAFGYRLTGRLTK